MTAIRRFQRDAIDVYGDAAVPGPVSVPVSERQPRRGQIEEDGRGYCGNRFCPFGRERVPICPATHLCVYACCLRGTFPGEHADAGCECWGDTDDGDEDDE